MSEPTPRETLAYDDGKRPRPVGWTPEVLATLLLRLGAFLFVILAAQKASLTAERIFDDFLNNGRFTYNANWLINAITDGIWPLIPGAILWLLTPLLVRLMFRELRRD